MNTDFINTQNSIPKIPIVLGIVGHRDLIEKDIPEIEKVLEVFFKNIKDNFPDTPFILLSSLAEGADRIAAKIALKQNIDLVVPLPMSVDDYCSDFLSLESKNEFNGLLSKAKEYFIVSDNINFISEINSEQFNDRDLKYASSGIFIANHSQLLIALWNGQDTKLIGGTSWIIKYKLKKLIDPTFPQSNILKSIENGPILHIMTPRISSAITIENPYSTRLIFPGEIIFNYPTNSIIKNETTFESPIDKTFDSKSFLDNKVFSEINSANKDIEKFYGKIKKDIIQAKDSLPPISNSGKKQLCFETLREFFAIFDILSIKFKKIRTLALKLIIAAIVIAFSVFQVYAELFHSPYLLGLYPLVLIAGTIIFKYVKFKDYENKHEDYRTIAEALRVQYFWNLNNLKLNIADNYLLKHEEDLMWIRSACRNLRFVYNYENNSSSNKYAVEQVIDLSLLHWIKNQYNWFKEKRIEYSEKSLKLEKTANGFFAFGMLSAVALLFFELFFGEKAYVIVLHHILVVSTGISLGLMAAIRGYLEKSVILEQLRQYIKIEKIFLYTLYNINQFKNYNDVYKKIIEELGREALNENADWLLLHHSHPLEMPKG